MKGGPKSVRRPISLTQRDLLTLDLLRRRDSPQWRALRELTGFDPESSDAALLRSLVDVALRAVADVVREEGYRELAAGEADSYIDLELGLDRRSGRDRRAGDRATAGP